jgi:ubiquinone/menaquinone biosynthesis C-methylase UbiE
LTNASSEPGGTGQDKHAERQYYDRLFGQRKRFEQFNPAIYERVAAELRSGTDGELALDIGCGSGDQAVCLTKESFRVIAADLSFAGVQVARETARQAGAPVVLFNGDAEHLPLPDASVDGCVCGLLLHHFPDLDRIASELRRVVKPGGAVVAIDANAHQPFAWLFFNVVHRIKPLPHLTPNQRALWSKEIRRVFGAHGFGGFRFSSLTSELRRDWLGDSLGARLNYHTRAAVLGASRLMLPQIAQGNMLLSAFRRGED